MRTLCQQFRGLVNNFVVLSTISKPTNWFANLAPVRIGWKCGFKTGNNFKTINWFANLAPVLFCRELAFQLNPAGGMKDWFANLAPVFICRKRGELWF